MSQDSFLASIRAAARGVWNGNLDALSGADAMFSAIGRGYEQAWQEGASSCGIKPDERTEEESKELTRIIGDHYQFVGRFVEWITAHSKANGGNLEMVLGRAFEWSNRYVYIETVAREMACKNQKEVWRTDPVKEHCCDCLRMEGRVYRNSTWAKYGIEPRSPALACFGGHCGCHREPTDLPITKGRPPALRGPGGCGKGKR